MSAQETTPGQAFSRAALMSFTTGNPRAEPLLGSAAFSLRIVGVSSSSSDASQPCTSTRSIEHRSESDRFSGTHGFGSYRHAWGGVACTYIDEAVVEVEAEEAGEDARVGGARLLDHAPHRVVDVRARAVVVRGAQLLRLRDAAQRREGEQGCYGHRRDRHRSLPRKTPFQNLCLVIALCFVACAARFMAYG